VRYNANGSVDTSFGTGGKAVTDFNGLNDTAFALAQQADGKFVVAGYATSPKQGSTPQNLDFALARYNPNGTLDTTFGVGRSPTGKVVTAVGTGNDVINALALQTDGKIVVAGYTTSFAGGSNFIVGRYNANGSLDTTFGNAGITVTDFGQADQATGMAIQADGKIVVAGTLSSGSAPNALGLARYNPNGSLDVTFGNQGKVVTTAPVSGNELDAKDVLIAGGQILVGGYGPGGLIVARYQNGVTGVTDGTLDPTFGTGGIAQTYRPTGAYLFGGSLALQANGKIVIAGDALTNSPNYDFVVARFESDGSRDDGSPSDSTPGDSFGTNGEAVTDFGATFGVTNSTDKAHAVAIQGDGKIVAAGESNSRNSASTDIALARYQGDAPLLAAAAPAKVTSTILAESQVQPILNEALARWQAAGVDVSALKNLTIRIMALSGNYLGMADGHTIYLDANAAGWGWFVDPTPHNDSEFITPGNQGEQHRMDLLTVLLHEEGHILGLEHEAGDGLMAETLTPGVRRLPDTLATPAVQTGLLSRWLVGWLSQAAPIVATSSSNSGQPATAHATVAPAAKESGNGEPVSRICYASCYACRMSAHHKIEQGAFLTWGVFQGSSWTNEG